MNVRQLAFIAMAMSWTPVALAQPFGNPGRYDCDHEIIAGGDRAIARMTVNEEGVFEALNFGTMVFDTTLDRNKLPPKLTYPPDYLPPQRVSVVAHFAGVPNAEGDFLSPGSVSIRFVALSIRLPIFWETRADAKGLYSNIRVRVSGEGFRQEFPFRYPVRPSIFGGGKPLATDQVMLLSPGKWETAAYRDDAEQKIADFEALAAIIQTGKALKVDILDGADGTLLVSEQGRPAFKDDVLAILKPVLEKSREEYRTRRCGLRWGNSPPSPFVYPNLIRSE